MKDRKLGALVVALLASIAGAHMGSLVLQPLIKTLEAPQTH